MSTGPGITYICTGCGQLVTDLHQTKDIDAGTTLQCPDAGCGEETVVDLSTRKERQDLYRAREQMILLPKYALQIVLDPSGCNAATVARAKAKVQEWLAEAA